MTIEVPPVRCDICGESWRHVVDGRVDRVRRLMQGRLFSGDEIPQTRDDKRSWSSGRPKP